MLIGIDIQDTESLRKFIGTNRMPRIFTKSELDYFEKKNNNLETVAGIYCAKEAFFKAIGKGINISQLLDIEIKHSKLGAPLYQLSPNIITQNNLSNAKISLSISHTKNIAVAVCTILKLDLFVS